MNEQQAQNIRTDTWIGAAVLLVVTAAVALVIIAVFTTLSYFKTSAHQQQLEGFACRQNVLMLIVAQEDPGVVALIGERCQERYGSPFG